MLEQGDGHLLEGVPRSSAGLNSEAIDEKIKSRYTPDSSFVANSIDLT